MVIKLKHLVNLWGKTVSEFDGNKRYYSTGNINTDNYELVTFENRPSRANLVVKEKDILIAKMKNTNKTTIATKEMEEYIFSTGFSILSPKNIDNKYLFYLLLSPEFIEKKDVFSVGTTQVSINDEALKNIEITYLKDKNEQKKVVKILDEKVNEINNIIEKTKQTIEDYNSFKQSIIVKRVTKGFNKCNNTKKSNIAWIEEIPEKWKILKISQLFSQVKEKNKGLIEKNLLSLSYGKIIRRNINADTGLLPENFEGYNIIESGDIVLRLTDLQNDHKSLRVGLCNEKGIITSAYLTMRLKQKYNSRYFYYLFHSFDIEKGFYGMGSGVRQGLNWEELKDMSIIIPSLEEQNTISDELDYFCTNIENLIENKKNIVEELEKYKKSLIYEYVTGKKEVI